ncbi:hypothetical protein NIIDMKKI_65630 [Mycobacterium kansasii]|uniref:Cytochrome C assembly family protein n=1 Tax=Mycobacterium kansasii TaxID=1768 RepID=A0A7G1IKQ5_MYCKA|nr:hypothetical protein NIIDMKKI_65630 [Mycobacterium kansasii]
MNTAHINIGLARYSDWAFTSAVVALVVALLLLAFELAYVRGRKLEPVAVAAGSVALDSTTPGIVADGPQRPFDERVGRAGLAVLYLGMGLLGACIVLRGLATMRVPWGNMYEFINLTCMSGLVAGAVVLRRPQNRPLWVFLLVPVLILLTVSGRWLYANAAPVMPALQSYWLPIHVSVVSLGSGCSWSPASPASCSCCGPRGWVSPQPKGRWPASCSGSPMPKPWTGSPTGPRSSPSRCSVSSHLRGHLGRGSLGPLLGLGPQGNGVLRRVGDLRGLPSCQVNRGLAGPEGGLGQCRRVRGHGLQPVLR